MRGAGGDGAAVSVRGCLYGRPPDLLPNLRAACQGRQLGTCHPRGAETVREGAKVRVWLTGALVLRPLGVC